MFNDRNNARYMAEKWVRKMETECKGDIELSLKQSRIIPATEQLTVKENKGFNTRFLLIDADTTTAIHEFYNHWNHIGALNFASFKNPGGQFLDGSMAQEEHLCHNSTLYCVLREFKETFYEPHKSELNRGLYTDDILYTPDIYFDIDGFVNDCYCDIITCAAPNRAASIRNGIGKADHYIALCYRIKRVLEVAGSSGIDTLILEAFGCGVFKNDPIDVANVFKTYLLDDMFKGIFNTVVFAIPRYGRVSERNHNEFFKVFEEVL